MRIKIMLIVLAVILVVMTAFSMIYVGINGTKFTDSVYYFDLVEEDRPVVTAVSENEDILKVGDFHYNKYDDKLLEVDLHSAGKSGNVNVNFYYNNEHFTFPYYVNDFGTVFARDTMNFTGFEVIEWDVLLGISLVAVAMLICFIKFLRESKYSYSMIAFGGLFLFCVFTVAFTVYEISRFNYFNFFLQRLLDAGADFAFYSAPVMLLFCLTVSVSNIWLIRHEGFRPVNALGIAISVVWLLALVFSLNYRLFHINLLGNTTLIWHIRNIMSFVVTYFECMLLSTSACAFISTRHTPPLDRDYIIILGCAIRRDGTLTPLLRGRVDSALSFEKKQFEETGKHARFVPSGGQGSDEIISEGEAMERYLIEQGVEPERIVREDKSVNTFQNMQFSRDRIMDDTDDFEEQKIAFSTTNYHIFRGYILADKNGFKAQGISAKTKWYFFPNAFIREFIGLLFDQKIRHLLIVALIAAIVVGVAYIL